MNCPQVAGFEFFGFQHLATNKRAREAPSSSEPAKKRARASETARPPIVVELENLLLHRSTATFRLKRKRSGEHRNATIHKLIGYASFGDVKSE